MLDKFSEAEYYYANVAEDRGAAAISTSPQKPGRGGEEKGKPPRGRGLPGFAARAAGEDPADCRRNAESCPCLPAAPKRAAAMVQLMSAMAFLASVSELLEGEK